MFPSIEYYPFVDVFLKLCSDKTERKISLTLTLNTYLCMYFLLNILWSQVTLN